METTKNQRVKSVISYTGMSVNSFSKKIGISQATLASMFNRGTEPKDAILDSIANAIPEINKIWLFTGKGEMLNATNDLSDTNTPIKSYYTGVPYYNVDFICGFDIIINDQTIKPEYYIDFKQYNSADCWCNVTGHSMEPEINPGDIIALKELHDWRTYIPSGEIYGIITTEHRTIKKVCPSSKEGYLKLIPTNKSPEYVEQDIPISIVLKVYKVLGCMKRL